MPKMTKIYAMVLKRCKFDNYVYENDSDENFDKLFEGKEPEDVLVLHMKMEDGFESHFIARSSEVLQEYVSQRAFLSGLDIGYMHGSGELSERFSNVEKVRIN
jgi:hypothetical protein